MTPPNSCGKESGMNKLSTLLVSIKSHSNGSPELGRHVQYVQSSKQRIDIIISCSTTKL